MKTLVRALFFLFQAAVVGLAAAFVAVWLKPGLLAGHGLAAAGVSSYSVAVTESSASVVNVHSARRVRQTAGARGAGDGPQNPGLGPTAPPLDFRKLSP